MNFPTNGSEPTLRDEDVDRVRGLLLGMANDQSESRAGTLRQAAAMLDYFGSPE